MLDVAAGNGNATLAAARRFAQVTSTDYVPQLLEKGAARAKAESLEVRSKRRMPKKPPLRRRFLRRGALHLRRDVRARSGQDGASCCAWCAAAAASGWRIGRLKGSSVSSFG
ncbi:MAG: class I SAM-dependent methyltransferase [Candidatus Competibacter sp.]